MRCRTCGAATAVKEASHEPTDWEDLVRSSFAAYLTANVPSSRDAYFEGCWANAGTFERLDIEQVTATDEPEENFDGAD